jgi:membrane-bound lytic murein transglycosylase D
MNKFLIILLSPIFIMPLVSCGNSEQLVDNANKINIVPTATPFATRPQAIIIPNDSIKQTTITDPIKDTLTTIMTKYVVQPGDSLSQIALDNNVTVEELSKINKLTDIYKILIDQVILIPKKTAVISDASEKVEKISESSSSNIQNTATQEYVVKDGDSGFSIAIKHNLSLEDFAKLNNKTIKELDLLYVGDKVLVPQS